MEREHSRVNAKKLSVCLQDIMDSGVARTCFSVVAPEA